MDHIELNQLGRTALHEAALVHDLGKIRQLLDEGFPVDVRDVSNNTPLYQAASRGFVEGLETLVAHGAHVDFRGSLLMTPLMASASYGQVEAGRWLMKHGADARAATPAGESALYMALSLRKFDFASMMLDERPDLQDDELTSVTKRMISTRHNLEQAQWLLRTGASPNQCNDRGHPWLVAAQLGLISTPELLMDLLLVSGAEVNITNQHGETALHRAAFSNDKASVFKLLMAGANPDLKDHNGETARERIMNQPEMVEKFTAWENSTKARRVINDTSSNTDLRPL